MKTIQPGQLIYWKGSAAIVLEFKGFQELIIRLVESGKTDIAPLREVSLYLPSDKNQPSSSHLVAEDKEWKKALERYEIIKPLLSIRHRSAEQVQQVAETHSKGIATIYRWIKQFEETGLVSSLLRQKRSDSGETKLDKEVEELIEAFIQNEYLQEERKSITKVFNLIKAECKNLDLPVPHQNTVYSRIQKIEDKEALKRRLGVKASKQKYTPTTGSFPGADYPNAVVQIDHTPVDLIIVDELHRLPIGRPYLTIAIDVATKMISGFKMTLDPPGSSSAGLCIGNAILPKDNWLAKRDIEVEWPIYGKMQKIHVDNAKEFRGNMLKRACQQHGIILEFRPKGQPNYGPHVERAFRTFMQETHTLPGTTFSNVKEKLNYNSEGKAVMTLSELELWFTIFLVYCYHHRPHRGINKIPPIKLYMECIFGDKDKPGIGLPAPIEDEETLRLDFTPYVERTIQRQGVEIDYVHYYSDALRKWIGAVDEVNPKQTRKFIFARDPRDISTIYFFDPDTERYIPIPYLNTSRPSISLWELKAVKKSLIEENDAYVIDEEVIFRGINRMREIEAQAIEKTRLSKQQRATEKRKRRMAERRNNWEVEHKEVTHRTEVLPTEATFEDEFLEDIQPFNDVELY
ncbi:Mu transposase C-terminal domain-containing protein [Marinomonas pontica]|uniref:Mu transposase C-terminal domain-containing protein n=1 Tax=Marinomonas pontica TaxID=264739 RepID=UPI002243AC56|nr:Mu transposase C-terminal domain-containing protein [Marinomonas pontica]MCW8354616.1 Mu transposase C-terminal domain-containing protein [Marinomonas pontica]